MIKPDDKSHSPQSSAKAWRRFRQLLLRRLQKLSKFNKKLDDQSPRKTIHDIRVLSRRTRAMLGILKQGPLHFRLHPTRKSVKKMTELLSPIRSLDVSATLLQERLKAMPEAVKVGLRFCRKEIRKLRTQARQSLAKHRKFPFSPGKLAKPAKSNREWFLPCLFQQADHAKARAKKSLAEYEANRRLPPLHQLRISLKKYRYLLEIHEECGGNHASVLSSLKDLQETLGCLHDLEVLHLLLSGKEVLAAARKHHAEKELQGFLGILQSELKAKEKAFLPRHRKRLKSLLSHEAP